MIYTVEMDDLHDETTPVSGCGCGPCRSALTVADVVEIGDCCLTPGDPSPVGRCPHCDGLVYVVEASKPADALTVAAPQMRDAIAAALPWIEQTGIADSEPAQWQALVAALALAGGAVPVAQTPAPQPVNALMLAALKAIREYEDDTPAPGTRQAEVYAQRDAAIAAAEGQPAPQTPASQDDADAAALLRDASATISDLVQQIGQMSGMFSDDDGTIAEAVEGAEAVQERIAAAMGKV